MRILANQIWELIDLAEGPDCPLYASRKSHREATLKVMADSGCFDEAKNLVEDFGDYFGEQTTPREVINWIAERLKSLTWQWEENNKCLFEEKI
jgi:hypothetical protein